MPLSIAERSGSFGNTGTWGQFDAAVSATRRDAVLKMYDGHGRSQTLTVKLRPGRQGTFK